MTLFKSRLFKHIIFWVVYVLYEISIVLFINPDNVYLYKVIIGFALNAGIFYTCSTLVFPVFKNKRKPIIASLILVISISSYILLSYFIKLHLYPKIENKPFNGGLVFDKIFVAQHLWRSIYFCALALGYWLAKESIDLQKNLRALEKERLLKEFKEQELEKEIVIAQLLSLKNQVNPHFLFNTLNFFYSSISPLSKTLAGALQKLSDIMRYSIKDMETDGLSDLADEIQMVYNFIDLNQLRYGDKLYVDFKIFGMANHKRILASAMMTLVENAFKYGELTDPQHPVVINLNIQFETFEFEIRNKKSNLPGLESNGIGLKNLRKRLELVYPDNFSIDIQEDKSLFSCKLKINMING